MNFEVGDRIRICAGSLSTYGFPKDAMLSGVIIAVYSSTVLMVQRDDGASCQVLFEDAIAEGAPQ